MDNDGYPEDDDIEWLKLQLSDMNFDNGAKAIKELIESTGYGKTTLTDGFLIVATGGWSGCEDILGAVRESIWNMAHWYSSTRGGREEYRDCRRQ